MLRYLLIRCTDYCKRHPVSCRKKKFLLPPDYPNHGNVTLDVSFSPSLFLLTNSNVAVIFFWSCWILRRKKKTFWGHQIFWIMQRLYILYCSHFVITFVWCSVGCGCLDLYHVKKINCLHKETCAGVGGIICTMPPCALSLSVRGVD